jgi:hypothetical protein
LNIAAVCDLARKHATGVEFNEDFLYDANCLACIHRKEQQLPFKTGRTRATRPGELIHMDLAGPMERVSLNRKKYFLLIKDDCSCGVWVNPLASKTQVVMKVQGFMRAFKNGYNACV